MAVNKFYNEKLTKIIYKNLLIRYGKELDVSKHIMIWKILLNYTKTSIENNNENSNDLNKLNTENNKDNNNKLEIDLNNNEEKSQNKLNEFKNLMDDLYNKAAN